jgi:glycerophosphoryl diester phosphodiesterase
VQFLVAHRAGNHVDGLHRAEALGVALIEADVRLFRGRAEVRHLKTIGPLPVFWDRWKLANPFSPRLVLGELLQSLAPSTELMLDLKGRNQRLAHLVLEALREAPTVARLTVCARSWTLLEPFRRTPHVRTVFSIGSKRQLRALARRLKGRSVDGISIHERLLDRQTVDQLQRYADVVMTWPVRTVDQARRLVDLGVQGLITDAPEELLGVLPPQTGR